MDDYDGKSTAQETVFFAVDGGEYEIDLSLKNAGKLRAAFEPWTENARRIGRIPRGKRKNAAARQSTNGTQTARVREWARENGYEVPSRGRVHREILEAYDNAH
ncbi:Lsr2 family protein [Nocardia africana]|uniref:Lsr2 family protein n=1 Tax=Nocardia africana TaxID=134964 RepID=A0ABW6NV83_9NOCA